MQGWLWTLCPSSHPPPTPSQVAWHLPPFHSSLLARTHQPCRVFMDLPTPHLPPTQGSYETHALYPPPCNRAGELGTRGAWSVSPRNVMGGCLLFVCWVRLLKFRFSAPLPKLFSDDSIKEKCKSEAKK